ncbi:MAG TPA: hypothetical protein VMJ64_15500 [Anaerolineales bacterium]|nr:hypothetical protein [Anaerolineales bacterium]
MQFVPLSIAIALIFSPLASAAAYMITYSEYVHHYPNNSQPTRLAIEAAVAAFIFFMGVSFIVGFLLENIIG